MPKSNSVATTRYEYSYTKYLVAVTSSLHLKQRAKQQDNFRFCERTLQQLESNVNRKAVACSQTTPVILLREIGRSIRKHREVDCIWSEKETTSALRQ